MTPENVAGLRVVAHEKEGRRLHLFVQGQSHEDAEYMGQVRVIGFEGSGPMRVNLQLGPRTEASHEVKEIVGVSGSHSTVLNRMHSSEL